MTAGRIVGLLLLLTAGLVHCEEAPAPECQVPEWPGQPPLQAPAGFRAVSDQEWTTLKPDSWDYLRRTSSKNDAICQDAANARSALEIVFTPDMAANTEPSVHWLSLPAANAVYAAWFVRLSPNWTPSPAGGGKIAFLHTPMGQVYTGFFGSHAPHHVSVNTEWAPYGQKIWDPNVQTTSIEYGKWYRIEWYMQWETVPGAGDGVIRWWVNGALNGDYRDIRYPIGGFTQFEFAPTLQNPPPAEQYMYVGHTYISVPSLTGTRVP